MTIIKTPTILAQGYHPQGIIEQRNISPIHYSRYYTTNIEMFKMLKF
jgi:hypothetical protein